MMKQSQDTDANETQEPAGEPQDPNVEPAPEEGEAAPADEVPVEVLPEEEEKVDPMTAMQNDVEKWRDVAVRSQAELDNYRKRMAREKTDALQYANSSLLQSLLPVVDNFEMGLKAAAQEPDGEKSVIFQGMVMVQKQIVDFLTENNVEIMDSTNQPFDPNVHEAIKQEPSNEVPEGSIIYELRRGYKLRDRLLRAANVVVSSGPETSDPS